MNLSPKLQDEVDRTGIDSLRRGKDVRRRVVIRTALVLSVLLIVLAAFDAPGAHMIAVIIAASSVCIVWAIMSMSASLNAQFDTLAALLAYYGERETRRSEAH